MVDWRRVKQWFHKNHFFERTPLNGWAYIYAANGIIEIAFWYTVIVSLLALTAYNVHQVTQHYLSKPIEYKIYMDGSTEHIEIPELTLTVMMQLFDWQERLPLQVGVTEKPSSGTWFEHFSSEQNDRFRIFRDFLCETATGYQDEYYLTDIGINTTEPEFLSVFYDSLVVNRSAALADFSDPRILHKWKDEMEKAESEYYEYWISVLTTPTQQQNRTLIGNRLTQIQDSQITKQPVETLIKLLAMKAVESGEDNVLANLGFSKDDLLIEKFNATATQLVRDFVADLANLIHFEMKPQGSVTLLDWNIHEFIGQQEFKFLLQLPPGTKSLQLHIYQRSFMWLKHVLQALDAVAKTFLKPLLKPLSSVESLVKLACSPVYGTTFETMIFNIFEEWILEYSNDIAYVSDSGNRWRVTAVPNFNNHISLVPHTVFQSTLDGCHNEPLESCRRQCVISKVAAKCSCIPWNVANLLGNSDWPSEELCDRHCAHNEIVEQCSEECGQKSNQSCKVMLTHVKGEFHEPFDSKIEILPKMDINISVAEFYPHAKQFKEYELTGTGYLSLLGGAIEFWSAMDVLGLIHLLVFIIIGLFNFVLKVKRKPVTEVVPQGTAMTLESIEQKYATAIESLNEGHTLPRWKAIVQWLKGNKFYEETPFTGYAFITEAESVIEIVLWYGIIALFATLAAYNLSNNINDYISRTTKVNIAPSTEKTPLPNATLKMILPIIILTEYNARVHYNITEEQSASDFQAIIRRILSKPRMDVGSVSKQLVDHWQSLVNEQGGGELWTLNQSEQASNSISHGDVFKKSLAHSIGLLEDWMARADTLSWSELQLPSSELMSGPRTGVDGLVFKLLLLRAIKTGEPIFKQLGGGGPQAAEILEQQGSTTEQLYNAVMGQLSRVLHVSGAEARISDIDFDEKYLQKGTFALQVELGLPPGATSAYIRVDSLVFLWIQELIMYSDYLYYGQIKSTRKFELNFETFADDLGAYNTWFDGVTYATLSVPTVEMPIITSSFANGMWFGMIQDFALFMQWTYHFAENSCPYKNEEDCIENCLQQEYLSLCGCIPWSVMEPNQQHRLCNEPCKIKINNCLTKCTNELCDKYVHKVVANNFKSVDVIEDGLFEFRLSVMQNLHMHFHETYEHSLGTFLAHIGGLLEFWLGVNVIALLHCVAYLFKYVYYLLAKKGNDTPSSVLNRLEGRLKEIDALRGQLSMDMTAAREGAHNGTLKELDDHSAIHWLYKNRFYETTPITGFKFIADARLGLERLFWAILILIFFVVTVFNVYTTIEYYGHKPTLLSTKVVHGSQPELGNLTLKLKANLIEFTQKFPTYAIFRAKCIMYKFDLRIINTNLHYDAKSNLAITDHLACDLTGVDSTSYINAEMLIRLGPLYDLLNFEHWTLNQTEWPKVPSVQSTEKVFQNWLGIFEKGNKALLEFWERYKSTPVSTLGQRQLTRSELTGLLDAPLKERNLTFLHGFFLLEAFNTGINPQTKLLDLLSRSFGLELLDTFQPTGQTVGELLGGVSAFELVKQMQQELNKMFLIRVIDEPNAEISLQGWSYKSESTTLSQDFDALYHQSLEYHIILPQNHSRTQVQIVTYSFLRMWHEYVIDSLLDHFKKNRRLSEQFICKSASRSIDSLIQQEYDNFNDYIMNPGSTSQDIYIETENFDFVTVAEWKPEEILLHLTGAFQSNTHNCSTISSQQCLDRCFHAYSMETCGCQSWGLLYLGEEGPVCTAPCRAPTHCLQQCQQVMQHPCQFLQSKAERTQFELKDPDFYSNYLRNAQHHVVIKAKGKSLISHKESYETVGSFIAQIGTLLDLWLGINLLSIIHLVVFIMKKVFHKRSSGLNSNLVENTDPSLLVELLEKRIRENIDFVHKETKLEIMKMRKQ